MISPDESYGRVHDSTIFDLTSRGDKITIRLQDINIEYDSPYRDCHYGILTICNVHDIYRNGEKVASVKPEIISDNDYGGMFAADQKSDRVVLAISWNRFNPKQSEFIVYDLMGAKISFELFQHPHDQDPITAPATDD